jgi:hypothetical protein
MLSRFKERILRWRDGGDTVASELLTVRDNLGGLRSLGYVGDTPEDAKKSNGRADEGP